MRALLVFDLDGTLVDSRRDLAESANELLATYDARPLDVEDVGRMVGEGARVLVERVLGARSVRASVVEALGRFLVIYERRLVTHTRPYPGIVPMLERASRSARLAVLTNKPSHHTTLLLEALGLSRFFLAALGGDGPFPRKPSPEALVHLTTLAGATLDRTLMVGDSPVDVETARRAGAEACFVGYGYGRFKAGEEPAPSVLQAVDVEALTACVLEFVDRT